MRILPIKKRWFRWRWPFGNVQVEAVGRKFIIPGWIMNSLRRHHKLQQDIEDSLIIIDSWFLTADVAVVDVKHEVLLLAEMPLSSVRDEARAQLEKWNDTCAQGGHCGTMLADHLDDLGSYIEYGIDKLRKQPETKARKERETLRELHGELTSLHQDVLVKTRELSIGIHALRQMLE